MGQGTREAKPSPDSTTIDGCVRPDGDRPYLLVVGSDARLRNYELPAAGAVSIGRGPGIDVDLPDPTVSRLHARLHVDATGSFALEDAGSANGTQVGKARLPSGQPVPLGIGQAFFVGSTMALIETGPLRWSRESADPARDEQEAAPELSAGRWRVVDIIDRTSERFLVAQEDQNWSPGIDTLTERERAVVVAAAAGRSNKEIAHDLGISHATARVLMARACARLGVSSRGELLELASVKAMRGGR